MSDTVVKNAVPKCRASIDYDSISPRHVKWIAIGIMVFILIMGFQCHVGIDSRPQRYELKEEAPEVPQLEIVEQGGVRKLLDPNGTVIGEVVLPGEGN